MSYLLDALNKSKGEQRPPNAPPQPVMYQQTAFATNEGINVYKWISIILALVLTLIVGIVLGNKYALLGVPEPVVVQPIQQPIQQVAPQANIVVPEKAEAGKIEAKKIEPKVAEPEKSEPETQVAKVNDNETAQDTQVHVISGEPRALKPVDEIKDTGLDNISNDLLEKFNQAIKESESVAPELAKQASQPVDAELDEYFSKVPKINELNAQQQMSIPTLIYETHLYSSDDNQRWVKINGKTLQQQQWINGDIQVLEIQRSLLILQMGHIRFSVPALTDWHEITQ